MPDIIHPRSATIDQRHDTGPFDVIGDVHGCTDELEALMATLGYRREAGGLWRSPDGRTPVFVGDFVDRGPRIADALETVMHLVAEGLAFAVPGNHDMQLARRLAGEDVPVAHGMDTSLEDLGRRPAAFQTDVVRFFDAIRGHYVFDRGRLVVSHTGLAEARHGCNDEETRQLAIYGVVEGEIDPNDINLRHSWLSDYAGRAAMIYGHTPIAEPTWVRRTIDIDTGCVYGWRLTALRWPERDLVSVDARREYATSHRDFY